MGKKGKWFSAVRRVFSSSDPEGKEAKELLLLENDMNALEEMYPQGEQVTACEFSCSLFMVVSCSSKVACGLTGRPKELIDDIDKLDGDNELAVVDYIEDIYKFYKTAQNENRPTDYMGSQPEINTKTRAILADWIVEVIRPDAMYSILIDNTEKQSGSI